MGDWHQSPVVVGQASRCGYRHDSGGSHGGFLAADPRMKIGVVSTTRLVRRGEEMVPNNDHWMKIQEIDLESVKGKLKERKGWWWGLWHSVTHLEEEYRRFLYLIA